MSLRLENARRRLGAVTSLREASAEARHAYLQAERKQEKKEWGLLAKVMENVHVVPAYEDILQFSARDNRYQILIKELFEVISMIKVLPYLQQPNYQDLHKIVKKYQNDIDILHARHVWRGRILYVLDKLVRVLPDAIPMAIDKIVEHNKKTRRGWGTVATGLKVAEKVNGILGVLDVDTPGVIGMLSFNSADIGASAADIVGGLPMNVTILESILDHVVMIGKIYHIPRLDSKLSNLHALLWSWHGHGYACKPYHENDDEMLKRTNRGCPCVNEVMPWLKNKVRSKMGKEPTRLHSVVDFGRTVRAVAKEVFHVQEKKVVAKYGGDARVNEEKMATLLWEGASGNASRSHTFPRRFPLSPTLTYSFTDFRKAGHCPCAMLILAVITSKWRNIHSGFIRASILALSEKESAVEKIRKCLKYTI